MDSYLLSDLSSDMPKGPSQITRHRSYDQRRRYILQTNLANLYSHSAMRQAIRTYTNIYNNRNITKSCLLKHRYPEVSALSALLYPRCGSCSQRNCALFRCHCCAIAHFCSHQCRATFLTRYPYHQKLDQRFAHDGLYDHQSRKRKRDVSNDLP